MKRQMWLARDSHPEYSIYSLYSEPPVKNEQHGYVVYRALNEQNEASVYHFCSKGWERNCDFRLMLGQCVPVFVTIERGEGSYEG